MIPLNGKTGCATWFIHILFLRVFQVAFFKNESQVNFNWWCVISWSCVYICVSDVSSIDVHPSISRAGAVHKFHHLSGNVLGIRYFLKTSKSPIITPVITADVSVWECSEFLHKLADSFIHVNKLIQMMSYATPFGWGFSSATASCMNGCNHGVLENLESEWYLLLS